ncbi:KTSC domain-containing protein [Planktothrix sp. FACHB-1355]|uniref:KTSC domain-containing protein n=1 Tax=Aerosakkonema funiforme FACHB-1375 TaxID=2949571 RepID=A0A926VHM7_9CYAN|nr:MULTISPECIES: KTSC domain-containing protein [Oscillatoriales]MBD2183900.1 KTSC domain-containing protein [Aerosakkonema funiforme FACHB-1375]MBD3561400.1 KTSC domain-containing protein [Planktothrix sp. FACHB-1355]
MKYTKIDLSNLVGISHDDEYLGLIIDRGDSIDVIEIPAPVAAYEGLVQLDAVVSSNSPELAASVDFYELPGVQSEIPMLPVHSTMANSIGYDSDRHLLQVEFKNGSVYQYEGVDEEIWEEMISTDSPGKFYNREIKGYYRSRRLDSDSAH